mmetsp:Transcript_34709/g.58140  ORF Transcript_34709/g.58140 Transcript_34709/m.58140 type:complete len:592 (+) Transcript_34709:34-1809(+)
MGVNVSRISPEARHIITCPVCLDIFKVPTSLPDCGHTLCAGCLYRIERDLCPLCKVPFTQPREHFHRNFVIQNAIDMYYASEQFDRMKTLEAEARTAIAQLPSTSSAIKNSSKGLQSKLKELIKAQMDELRNRETAALKLIEKAEKHRLYDVSTIRKNLRKAVEDSVETLSNGNTTAVIQTLESSMRAAATTEPPPPLGTLMSSWVVPTVQLFVSASTTDDVSEWTVEDDEQDQSPPSSTSTLSRQTSQSSLPASPVQPTAQAANNTISSSMAQQHSTQQPPHPPMQPSFQSGSLPSVPPPPPPVPITASRQERSQSVTATLSNPLSSLSAPVSQVQPPSQRALPSFPSASQPSPQPRSSTSVPPPPSLPSSTTASQQETSLPMAPTLSSEAVQQAPQVSASASSTSTTSQNTEATGPSSQIGRQLGLIKSNRLELGALDRSLKESWKEFRRLGGLEVILSTMKKNARDEKIQNDGCRLLWYYVDYSGQHSPSNDDIEKAGGIPVIISAMRGHLSKAMVQWYGCDALKILSKDHTANKVIIAEAGGISALFEAMHKYSLDAHLTELASEALANLAEGNPSNQAIIESLGGI